MQVVRSSDNALNNFSHQFKCVVMVILLRNVISCFAQVILGYSTPKTRGHVDFRAGQDKLGQGVNTCGQGVAPF